MLVKLANVYEFTLFYKSIILAQLISINLKLKTKELFKNHQLLLA